MVKVRVGKRGTIVIPKEVRRRLNIREGEVLELSVEDDKIVLRIHDLWSDLRRRGRKIKVNPEKAEEELNRDEEEWERRLKGLL